MRILFIGDVVGEPGIGALDGLAAMRSNRGIDFCIVNAENAADGFGLTEPIAERLFAAGADVLTGGNHLWDKKKSFDYLAQAPRVVRPANASDKLPGRKYVVVDAGNGVEVGVLNLLGRVFMTPAADCPFRGADRIIEEIRARTPVIVVDMHAEATSEKVAMGWHLDGRVSAVLGTHTHIQTADETVLPGGTAYITDVGMTGPYASVIGVEREQALNRFLTGRRQTFATATGDPRLSAVIIEVDAGGRALAIGRLQIAMGET